MVLTFRITNFPLDISFFFLFVLTAWPTGIKFGQGRLLPFHLHFPTAMDITKGGPMGPDPAWLCTQPKQIYHKLFHFLHQLIYMHTVGSQLSEHISLPVYQHHLKPYPQQYKQVRTKNAKKILNGH